MLAKGSMMGEILELRGSESSRGSEGGRSKLFYPSNNALYGSIIFLDVPNLSKFIAASFNSSSTKLAGVFYSYSRFYLLVNPSPNPYKVDILYLGVQFCLKGR